MRGAKVVEQYTAFHGNNLPYSGCRRTWEGGPIRREIDLNASYNAIGQGQSENDRTSLGRERMGGNRGTGARCAKLVE